MIVYKRKKEGVEAAWVANDVMSYDWFFFFQAEDGIRDVAVTGVQTCALPILEPLGRRRRLVHQRLVGGPELAPVAVTRDRLRDHPARRRRQLVVRRRGDERARSEERRVGKECRSRWSPYH